MPIGSVPPAEAWGDIYHWDGLLEGYEMLCGKSVDEVIPLVADHPIEVAEGISRAPPQVFYYYIFAFVTFLLSRASRGFANPANVFLDTVQLRVARDNVTSAEARDDESFLLNASELWHAVAYVATRQPFYGASPEIYGSFQERSKDILDKVEHYGG